MRSKHYLKGLTSIRFILATLVVLTHCNQNLKSFDIYWLNNSPILHRGGFAVECFFILSGFLLTHLAYLEFKEFGNINFKLFFIRRVLRIFPLYYLAVFLGYFFLGVLYPLLLNENYLNFSILEGLPYHILFLPNWIIAKHLEGVGSLYGLWSIGVEEQFYLFFPIICSIYFSKKRPVIWFGITAFIFLYVYNLIQTNYPASIDIVYKYFFKTLKFHFMLIGATFALLFQRYRSKMNLISSNPIFQVIILCAFIMLITSNYLTQYDVIYASLFCIFLISITGRSHILNFWENKYFKYLGSISFGIYIYHPLVSYPMRYLLEFNESILAIISKYPLLYYITELFITIIIASISYELFEMKFLNKKKKYVL